MKTECSTCRGSGTMVYGGLCSVCHGVGFRNCRSRLIDDFMIALNEHIAEKTSTDGGLHSFVTEQNLSKALAQLLNAEDG